MNALSVLSRCFFLVPTTAALSSDSFWERAIEAAGPRVRREESIHQSSETEEEAPVGGKEQGSGTAPGDRDDRERRDPCQQRHLRRNCWLSAISILWRIRGAMGCAGELFSAPAPLPHEPGRGLQRPCASSRRKHLSGGNYVSLTVCGVSSGAGMCAGEETPLDKSGPLSSIFRHASDW